MLSAGQINKDFILNDFKEYIAIDNIDLRKLDSYEIADIVFEYLDVSVTFIQSELLKFHFKNRDKVIKELSKRDYEDGIKVDFYTLIQNTIKNFISDTIYENIINKVAK